MFPANKDALMNFANVSTSMLSSHDAVVKEEHIKSFGLNPFFSLPSTLITHKYKSEPFEALFMLPDFDFADFTSSKGKKTYVLVKLVFLLLPDILSSK